MRPFGRRSHFKWGFMKFRSRKGIRAFGMIEVMFGMMVTVGGTMVVLSMMSMSTKVAKQSEVRSAALTVARKQMERIKMMASTNRPAMTHQTFTVPPDALAQFPNGGGGIELSGEYSISFLTSNPNCQQIVVALRWRNISSQQSSSSAPWSEVTLTSLITPQPINISYTGVSDPPPPPPPTTGSTGTIPDEEDTTGGWTPTSTDGGSDGSSGSSSSGSTTGGEEVGGCTFTYGPC